MSSLADGFIALPGGFGTFEELFEVITWGQLGLQKKPIGLVNVEGFFDPVLELIDHAIREEFVRAEQRQYLSAHLRQRNYSKCSELTCPSLPGSMILLRQQTKLTSVQRSD